MNGQEVNQYHAVVGRDRVIYTTTDRVIAETVAKKYQEETGVVTTVVHQNEE